MHTTTEHDGLHPHQPHLPASAARYMTQPDEHGFCQVIRRSTHHTSMIVGHSTDPVVAQEVADAPNTYAQWEAPI